MKQKMCHCDRAACTAAAAAAAAGNWLMRMDEFTYGLRPAAH